MRVSFPWLEQVNPQARPGRVRWAVFDFDDTISALRRGWQEVMAGMMLEVLCPQQPPSPGLVREVEEYVRASTGAPTLVQMSWLEAAARCYGAAQPLSALEYKRQYNQRLMALVERRTAGLSGDPAGRERWLVAGARDFLAALSARGVRLSLASGTDHADVVREAGWLGVDIFFDGGIFGAQPGSAQDMKAHTIRRVAAQPGLQPGELLVAGDGAAEMSHGRGAGALTLGVSGDAVRRRSLVEAGADLLVADFSHTEELARLLAGR